jgi:RNA polymerase sigma factor (sigma-70 family)
MSPSVSARLLLTQSDARLVAFARAGHERAFEALVRRYRGPLLGYCRRLLLSEERAEDALQQALTQAWLALRADTEVHNVKAWLYRIVHNSALNALRVSGYDYCTLSESLSGAGAPQEDLDRRIAVREALAGLAALPQMQREALLRTAVEGSSHREAARELGVSEPALRGLVYRARAALRATAGAIVPAPLLSWALNSGGGAPVGASLAEVGAGTSSAGVVGLLMKGGTMAVTAGVLVGGIAAVHVHPRRVSGQRAPLRAHRQARSQTPALALAGAHPAQAGALATVREMSAAERAAPAHRSISRARRLRGHRHEDRAPAGIVPASAPGAEPDTHGDRRGAGEGSGGVHERLRGSGAGGGGDAKGQGSHDGERRSLGGDGSGGGERDGGPSGGETGSSVSTGAVARDGGGGDRTGQDEQLLETSEGGESSSGDRGLPETTTTTSVAPASEAPPSEGGK